MTKHNQPLSKKGLAALAEYYAILNQTAPKTAKTTPSEKATQTTDNAQIPVKRENNAIGKETGK